jgi:ribosomal 50S subunit-recycling heat shock protein
MRCDLCLSRLCLFKTRSQAARACEEGRVRINGRPVRSSHEVKPGDHLCFQDPSGRVEQEFEILSLPKTSVSKQAAREAVRLLSRTPLKDPWDTEAPPSGPEEDGDARPDPAR